MSMPYTLYSPSMTVNSIQVICIDELRTDYKNPIDQCTNLNQVCGGPVETGKVE